MDITDLELSVRTHNLMKNEGIDTIALFRGLTKREVLKWKGAGAKTWREIAEIQQHVFTSMRRASIPGQAAALIFQLNELRPALAAQRFFIGRNSDGLLRLFREVKKEDFNEPV